MDSGSLLDILRGMDPLGEEPVGDDVDEQLDTVPAPSTPERRRKGFGTALFHF